MSFFSCNSFILRLVVSSDSYGVFVFVIQFMMVIDFTFHDLTSQMILHNCYGYKQIMLSLHAS